MTNDQKLAYILKELKQVAFPDENTNYDDYWEIVDSTCDNAVDAICDTDILVKKLITIIEI